MNSKFSRTVERPLRLLLNQELLQSHRPIPPSRTFDGAMPRPSIPSAPAVGFSRIFVPTDFSCYATMALAYARRLAARLGAEVILFHGCKPVAGPPGDAFAGLTESRRSARQLAIEAELAKQIAATNSDVPADARPVRTLVCEGIPHKRIVTEAMEQRADLIVSAKHGHSEETHQLLGKTAEFLVRNAPCPVLLIGEEGAVFPARRSTAN